MEVRRLRGAKDTRFCAGRPKRPRRPLPGKTAGLASPGPRRRIVGDRTIAPRRGCADWRSHVSIGPKMEQNEITRRGFLARAAIGATALIAGERLSGETVAASPAPTPQAEGGDELRVALLQMTSAITHPDASPPWNMIKLD